MMFELIYSLLYNKYNKGDIGNKYYIVLIGSVYLFLPKEIL